MVYKKIAAALRQARRAAAVTVSLTVLSMPVMADGQVLRIAMTASDIPLTTGQPDSGFEGYRFLGYTVYDALINWDLSSADEVSGLTPGLAESWEVDEEDTRVWTFTLRQGVSFHDGSEWNADAAIWNLDKVYDEESPQFDARQAGNVRGRIPAMDQYEKVDDHTIRFTTREPDAWFPYQLTFLLFSSPAQWEALGGDWDAFAREPSGTGPFRLTRLVPRERAVLEPNADYWDAERVPRIERIELIPMPESSTRTSALLSDQVDWIETPAPDAIPRMESRGMTITSNPYPHTWPYQFSMLEGSPWRDINVRKAANLAVDREGLEALLGGLMVPAAGIVTPDHPWYGEPEFETRYDPEEAMRLLEESGYGPDNPVEVKVLISTSGSGQMQPLAMNEYIQQNLAEVGIALDFEVLDWESLFPNWRRGAEDPSSRGAHATNITFGWLDPFAAFYRFMHSSMAPPNGFNWGYMDDPEYDRLLDEARVTFDQEAQDAILAEFHARMVDDAAWLWVAHDVGPRAMQPRVKGFVQAKNWFQDLTPVYIEE
ncbi:ABC transporter substrate-binding protein [Halomonas daqingensis]|uniref:ABC transporter substrate-binding protein n=1 Tax=Billgrantia desiderata TaxID=52021 RepID=A0ABS9B205_9GAMM|nr:ABC transporter substrate-binding protein [Halomonas desiderata]MCE8041651.1 ABC transporter substrate-binding protein [Halomonas desiderata]MCE8046226.1 ABC transporter substrate-binding protein [Halomonas desiderata]